ncbi:MAG: DNA primase [Prevotella sp.]|nr:DNA primase [Prevotella sp.]MBP3218899.1 DNA primase [Prevotella sp.]
MIEQKYIDEVLDKVDLTEVAEDYGITLKLKGHRAWACCPFHNEDTASFCIDTAKNLYHCFGCGKGGNVINFVMEKDGLTFPLAVKKLLKEKLGHDLTDKEMKSTPEEEEKHKKRESMRIINDRLATFFVEQLQKDTEDARMAKTYMLSRWNEKYCQEQRIGYAPKDWHSVVDFAIKTGMSLDLLQETGILRVSEKNNKLYCVYRNRIMIPIRDRYNRIEGFTARALDEDADCKYLNSSDSELYHKSHSIFGIDSAIPSAKKQGKLFLVEGAPDVMKLQSLDISNAIASLGGSWSESQFQKLKDFRLQDCTLCFIPDSDIPKDGTTLGAGFQNVIRNGALAMQHGYTVSVKEIPNDLTVEQPKKIDPDEFFCDKSDLNRLEEREYLLWAFEKKFDKNGTTEEKQKVIDEACTLLLCIKDEAVLERYITELAKMDGNKTIWRQAYNSAKKRQQEHISEKNKEGGIDMLRSFGFTVRNGSYYGFNKNGDEVQWSNFTLKPLFHIKDDIRPVRLFEICNTDSQKEIIELDMEVFTSAKSLRKKLLGIGNYTWLAGEEPLIQLQRYLAKVTETAVEIKQLGWQQQGFYCFCNGAFEDNVWHPVDYMGIVRLKAGNYYLPAMSQIYKDSRELYVNERKFCHLNQSNISLHDYFAKIINVFGDNAIITLCFYLATLFRDIIKPQIRFFPLLNVFGPKGSGKTELAETIMTFFTTDNEPLNIETATIPALSDSVASVSNATVHIDEFKNGIDIKKIEMLKDYWGGYGRCKMNMDKDKKREQARVDCGIILTGQEMPTIDIALFTRLIFLTCEKQHHSQEECEDFTDLLLYRQMGATHITQQILCLREQFKANFSNAMKRAETDVRSRLGKQKPADRIKNNWTILLSVFLSLDGLLDFPFQYEHLLELCVSGIIRQDRLCAKTDELSRLWDIISSAHQKGIFVYEQNYVIRVKERIKVTKDKGREELTFDPPRRVLMVRKDSMLNTYRQLGKQMDEKLLPSESILHYLQNTPEYFGRAVSPERFKSFNSNGQPIQELVTDSGSSKLVTKYQQDRPLCFDYTLVSEKYGISLESFTGEQEEDKLEAQQQDLPF